MVGNLRESMPQLHSYFYSFINQMWNLLAKRAMEFNNINVVTKNRPITKLKLIYHQRSIQILKALLEQISLHRSQGTPIIIQATVVTAPRPPRTKAQPSLLQTSLVTQTKPRLPLGTLAETTGTPAISFKLLGKVLTTAPTKMIPLLGEEGVIITCSKHKKLILLEYKHEFSNGIDAIVTKKKVKTNVSHCSSSSLPRMKSSTRKHYRVQELTIYKVITNILKEYWEDFTATNVTNLLCLVNKDFSSMIPKTI